jgi:hypothetical protein
MGTVPEIMAELFDTYGTITPQALNEATMAAETPARLMNFGLLILTK